MERNAETKESLIKEIEQKVKDKILEQNNADLLIKLINKADTPNEAMAIAELGTMYEKTGLKFDVRLEKMSEDIKYFQKNKKLSFHQDDTKPTHKLIIGDNYDALQNLLIEYKGKIDVIYIDPPYGKDSMGEFAATNYNNNITRDNLLSMLYPRLQLAKQLLSNEGVIFCSIDDKNQAYVKCLFDNVFGERNFIANINVLDNLKGKENDNFISQTSHYVITYTKCKPQNKEWGFNDVATEVSLTEKYKLIDKEGKCYTTNTFKKTGAGKNREDRPYMFYPILINKKNLTFSYITDDEYQNIYVEGVFNDIFLNELKTKYSNNFYFILPIDSAGKYLRWTSGFEAHKELIKNGMLIINKNKGIEQIKYPKDIELIENSVYGTPKNFVYKSDFANGTIEFNSILNTKFDNPKSVTLIKYLIRLIPTSATILDFFAGSGTTGHAVLEMNKEDNGKRTFILCQMNEKTDTTPKGIATEVTAERLKRIMTGEGYKGEKDFKWRENNEPYKENLDVYDIKTVANFEQTKGKTAFDVIDERLYGQEKFKTLKEKIEWVANNFAITQNNLETKEEWQERQKGEK